MALYPTPAAAIAANDVVIMRCYCNANLFASFSDSAISSACSSYLTEIYVEQAIQYLVIITSSVINILFGLLVHRLVEFTRPNSRASALMLKSAIFTLFLLINSIVIPILIYADIYNFKASDYVSLLTIISSNIKDVLLVNSLSFYPNFDPVWYRNVSPLFTNYLIFNTLVVWGSFIITKCCSSTDSLQSD